MSATKIHAALDTTLRGVGHLAALAVPGAEGAAGATLGPPPAPGGSSYRAAQHESSAADALVANAIFGNDAERARARDALAEQGSAQVPAQPAETPKPQQQPRRRGIDQGL